MRARTLRHRAASALLGLWLVAFVVVPPGLRPCPMHQQGTGRDASPSHDAGHGHGSQMPSAACECATNCCGAPSVAVAEARVRVASVAIEVAEAPLPESPPGLASARVRFLPFANAPPAA